MTPRTLIGVGRSQSPLINDGDKIEWVEVRSNEIGWGSLVVFRRAQFQVCHRVIGKRNGKFLTKGDHLALPDGWIESEAVLGKVTAINGQSIQCFSFRVLSLLSFTRSLLTFGLYWSLFRSPLGKALGFLRRKFFRAPFAEGWFQRIFG